MLENFAGHTPGIYRVMNCLI